MSTTLSFLVGFVFGLLIAFTMYVSEGKKDSIEFGRIIVALHKYHHEQSKANLSALQNRLAVLPKATLRIIKEDLQGTDLFPEEKEP